MTKKLNLSPLINHFKSKSPTIAAKLADFTKTAEDKPFESAFLEDTSLKEKIDSLSKKSSTEELEAAKNELARVIHDSPKFKKEKKIQELKKLQAIKSPTDLQFYYYNYIQASFGQKVLASDSRLSKIANTLVEIADELDTVDPELAKSADLLLQELLKEASGMCPLMGKEGHACTEMCMRPLMEEDMFPDHEAKSFSVQDIVDQGHDDLPEEVLEIEDPDISAPAEPEPEYDEVSLEDLDTRLDGLNWRIADRPRREALEKAKEHALKAKQYYDAFKRYKDKTHSIFDEAGEALRLKKFD